MEEHQGGCLCGQLRYITKGAPYRAAVCHCRYCQLRSGSAFGNLVYFADDQIEIVAGELKDFHFTSESGYAWQTRFCGTCGTTVFCHLERRAGLTAICAGTFDPPSFWFDLNREVFTRTKAPYLGDITASEHADTMAGYSANTPQPDYLKGKKEE